MAFTLHEIHAVEAEGFHFDESLSAGDFGPGDVVDEHVFDGAFATLDVCCLKVRLIVVGFRFFASLRTNSSHGRHFEMKLCVEFGVILRSVSEIDFKHLFRMKLS